MQQLRIQRLGDNLKPVNKNTRNKIINTVTIPEGWWNSFSTFDFISEKESAPIFNLHRERKPAPLSNTLPLTNYWKIRQGDYRSKADKSKLVKNKKQKKILDLITLISAVIISTALTLAVSFIIAKV